MSILLSVKGSRCLHLVTLQSCAYLNKANCIIPNYSINQSCFCDFENPLPWKQKLGSSTKYQSRYIYQLLECLRKLMTKILSLHWRVEKVTALLNSWNRCWHSHFTRWNSQKLGSIKAIKTQNVKICLRRSSFQQNNLHMVANAYPAPGHTQSFCSDSTLIVPLS